MSPPQNEIKVDLFYGEELVKTYSSENISSWREIYNETAYNFSTHPNVVLGFVLSTTNIVDLKDCYVNLTFNRTEVKTIDDWVEEEVQTNDTEHESGAEKTEQPQEETEEQKA